MCIYVSLDKFTALCLAATKSLIGGTSTPSAEPNPNELRRRSRPTLNAQIERKKPKTSHLGSSGELAADRLQWTLGAVENGDFEAARDLIARPSSNLRQTGRIKLPLLIIVPVGVAMSSGRPHYPIGYSAG
jgi:hypothetical protein